jgi:hypothetical protein
MLVLLDGLGPEHGAQACAQDWARLMDVPLVEAAWPNDLSGLPAILDDVPESDLLIFGQYLAAAQKAAILQATYKPHSPAVLVCPQERLPLSRVLLLDRADEHPERLLATAAQFGPFFEDGLVILTLAQSQRAGQRRQEKLREALEGVAFKVELDLLVSRDLCAISHVAQWRQCSLLVLERSPQNWWGRLWGDPIEAILQMSGLPPMLALAKDRAGCVCNVNNDLVSRKILPQPAHLRIKAPV